MRKLSIALIVLSLFWVAGLDMPRGHSTPGAGAAHGSPAPMVPFGDDGGGSH